MRPQLPGMVMLMLALVGRRSARANHRRDAAFKDEAQEQQFCQSSSKQLVLPEMPEQQHCGLERDDSHRHAPQGV